MKLLLALAILLSYEAITAQTVNDLEERLTGGEHQKWKLIETDGEPENSCEDLTYVFYMKNRILFRLQCNRRDDMNWSIAANEGELKKSITLYRPNTPMKSEYEIQFVRKNNETLLRLRSADLRKQTTDYYFQPVDH